jgi:predicted negative regulator of RcsB-dependent stress response
MFNLYTIGAILLYGIIAAISILIVVFLALKVYEAFAPYNKEQVAQINTSMYELAKLQKKVQEEIRHCGKQELRVLQKKWGSEIIRQFS